MSPKASRTSRLIFCIIFLNLFYVVAERKWVLDLFLSPFFCPACFHCFLQTLCFCSFAFITTSTIFKLSENALFTDQLQINEITILSNHSSAYYQNLFKIVHKFPFEILPFCNCGNLEVSAYLIEWLMNWLNLNEIWHFEQNLCILNKIWHFEQNLAFWTKFGIILALWTKFGKMNKIFPCQENLIFWRKFHNFVSFSQNLGILASLAKWTKFLKKGKKYVFSKIAILSYTRGPVS